MSAWECPLCHIKTANNLDERRQHQCLGLIDQNRRGWVSVMHDALRTGWPMTEGVRVACSETLRLLDDVIDWYKEAKRQVALAQDELERGPAKCATCISEHFSGHPNSERVGGDGGK